jgi:hypothetical protein
MMMKTSFDIVISLEEQPFLWKGTQFVIWITSVEAEEVQLQQSLNLRYILTDIDTSLSTVMQLFFFIEDTPCNLTVGFSFKPIQKTHFSIIYRPIELTTPSKVLFASPLLTLTSDN